MLYRLSNLAETDIRQIYLTSLELFGRVQADRYFRDLEAIFCLLGDCPKLARLRREINPPVRIHPFGSHLIVYREESSGGILVIRVRHQRENWQEEG